MEIKTYSKIDEIEKSTRLQLKEHFKNFINESNLDKNQIYSWPYFNQFKIISEKESDKKSTRILKFCEIHGWCAHYKSSGKCNRCQSDKYGLGNKEIHQKTIQSQLKNGTFNMLDPEVQKHKTSNSNLNDKIIDKFCDICQIETKHHLWPTGRTSCMKCNSKNNGFKFKECLIHGNVLFNGSKCTLCENSNCNHKNSRAISIDGKIKCLECYRQEIFNYVSKSNIEGFYKLNKDFKGTYLIFKDYVFVKFENNIPQKIQLDYEHGFYFKQGKIKEVAEKLNLPYGTKTTFLPEKLQSCGHITKSVLIDNHYQCWQCYKEKYFKNLKSDFNEGFLLPTFLSQYNTNSIPGNKFEELLIEKNITYFVYIKFHENGKPLVVGESASKLINNSGSDLSFDKDINGGPARQLLIETNTNWDRTSVSIIKTNNKEESILLEYFLSSKYSLLMS